MLNWLEIWNSWISGGVLPLALSLTGSYFLVVLRGVWLHPARLRHGSRKSQRSGGVSPMRAMSLSLAGVLGVGNLVGVAGALLYGGAGAIFWMWVSATLAMSVKYAEVVLALQHRRRRDGVAIGCAMYYMEDSFRGRFARIGRGMALLFAALLLVDALCMGCMIQIGAVSDALGSRFGLSPLVIGLLFGGVLLVVGLRGEGPLTRLTRQLVPIMTLGFCLLCVVAIARQREAVPSILRTIVKEGLSLGEVGGGRRVLGGIGAFWMSRAVRYGTMRGLLSNEAGCGTSPMAHADTASEQAREQGMMGVLEVFVDTHLLCSMTALVILLAFRGEALPALSPMMLTLHAFERLLGEIAGIVLPIAVACFGLATVLCWLHYWQRTGAYLFPSHGNARFARLREGGFLLIYSAFSVVGALGTPQLIWQLSDLAIGMMTLLNLFVLLRERKSIVNAR